MSALITRECSICSRSYEAEVARLRHGRQTTCSRACSYRYRAAKTAEAKRGRPSPLRGIPTGRPSATRKMWPIRECPVCLVTFQVTSKAPDQQFCSKPCAYKGRRPGGTFRPGPLHPAWIDGQAGNGYPPEFSPALKRRIRERDGHTCQLCAMTEEEHLRRYERVLCVNHIDFDKTNCAEDNLNTLCIGCNTRINFDRPRWTAYFQQQREAA